MTAGLLLFDFDLEQSITIYLILEVLSTKKLSSHQSTHWETSSLYSSLKKSVILPHWLVSSANLISGHDDRFCLPSVKGK